MTPASLGSDQGGHSVGDTAQAPSGGPERRLPGGDGPAQRAGALQESRGVLQQGGQPGALLHRALHRQEAAAQLVNQTGAHHVAACEEKRVIERRVIYHHLQR